MILFFMPRQLEPTYRDALTKSWQVLLHHKLLWVLGAIALILGQFGLGNFLGSLWTFMTEGQVSLIPWLPSTISWSILSPVATVQLAILIVIGGALAAFIVVVATCAQGAIITAMLQYFSGRRTISLRSAWHTGARHFWRILAVNVIQQIVLLFTISAVLGFWRDFSHTSVGGIIMLIIGIALGLFIALLTSVLSIYTLAFIVDKEYPLSEAVGAGYELFKNHLLVSLEISFLLLLLTIVPALAIIIASYVVIVPGLPFLLIGTASSSVATVQTGIMVMQIFFAILVALISGAFNAFMIGTWMYCYRAMEKRGVPSRLVHHTEKVFKKEPKSRVRTVRGRII